MGVFQEPPLAKEELYFAVKTCHKYHETRVPFVQKTWGKDAKYLEFFSDVNSKFFTFYLHKMVMIFVGT